MDRHYYSVWPWWWWWWSWWMIYCCCCCCSCLSKQTEKNKNNIQTQYTNIHTKRQICQMLFVWRDCRTKEKKIWRNKKVPKRKNENYKIFWWPNKNKKKNKILRFHLIFDISSLSSTEKKNMIFFFFFLVRFPIHPQTLLERERESEKNIWIVVVVIAWITINLNLMDIFYRIWNNEIEQNRQQYSGLVHQNIPDLNLI